MQKHAAYMPIRLLKIVAAAYPSAWKQMQDFHDSNGIGLPSWESWCYAPMAAAYAVASCGNTPRTVEEGLLYAKSAEEIAALAPWRLSKEVFSIDQDLEQLLYEQGGDDGLPSAILLQLPYQAFYVQTNFLAFNGVRYHGFFVHLEQDVNNGDRELRILLLDENCETWAVPVHIDERTVGDSLQITLNQARENLRGSPEYLRGLIASTDYIDALGGFYQQIMQIVLYLLSVNSDVAESPEQKTVMKRSATTVKDKYSELRKWDVGVRVGASIRAHKSRQNDSRGLSTGDGSPHASPRPHIRRAHWHHYWTGKKDGVSERKLILKWQAPTFIGAQDDLPVTIHNVKP